MIVKGKFYLPPNYITTKLWYKLNSIQIIIKPIFIIGKIERGEGEYVAVSVLYMQPHTEVQQADNAL